MPYSEPAINGMGELGGSRYAAYYKPIRVEQSSFAYCSSVLAGNWTPVEGQLQNSRRENAITLDLKNNKNPRFNIF